MLLVCEDYDRSERVLAAMKCRGFHSRYSSWTTSPSCRGVTGPFYAAIISVGGAVILGTE